MSLISVKAACRRVRNRRGMMRLARSLLGLMLAVLLAATGSAGAAAGAAMAAPPGTVTVALCAGEFSRPVRLTPAGRELPADDCPSPCLDCLLLTAAMPDEAGLRPLRATLAQAAVLMPPTGAGPARAALPPPARGPPQAP
jgi:hypothetical protein